MAATTDPSLEPARNSTSIDAENVPPSLVQQQNAEEEFPVFKKLIFILIAIYLSMFIIALVGIAQSLKKGDTLTIFRIERFSALPSQRLRTTSMPSPT